MLGRKTSRDSMRGQFGSCQRARHIFLSLILLSLYFAFSITPAFAQQAPTLGYVFPPAVRAGATTDVKLGGYDFTPDMQFFVHHPRIQLKVLGAPSPFLIPPPPYWFGEKGRSTAFPIPREIPARITVPANTPSGPVFWQVANANGGSTTAVVYVSNSEEIVEKRYRDDPQSLKSIPVSISGRLERIAEADRYRFTAKRGGLITVELMARRLGANFHGLIEVREDSGKLLASSADTEGVDTALTFAAKKDETYLVRVHDVDFRGNRAYVYRLSITSGPRVVATIPAYGRRGHTSQVKFVGYGIATGASHLETTQQKAAFPKIARPLRYELKTPHGSTTVVIPISDLAEHTESSGKRDGSQKLSAPAAVTGVLSEPAEQDRYVFESEKGKSWRIAVQSRELGSNLDVALTVFDPKGTQIKTVDDVGGLPDAGTTIRTKVAGLYTCVVRDLSGHDGNVAAVYRLSVMAEKPDFTLAVPQQIKVGLGGKATIAVKVIRHGGFAEPIQLRIAGLPPGVRVDEKTTTIPAKKNAAKLIFEVAKDSATQAALLTIVGEAKFEGKTISRTATAIATGNLCPRSDEQRQSTQILLATTMAPPFAVELIDKNRQRAVHRGTTYPAEFIIKRDNGFAGEIFLQMAARQSRHRQGITGPILKVPPKAERVLYPCFMPEWLETDRTTRMVVLGVAKMPDPKGNTRYLTKPANARITMILEGALLKLGHSARELTIQPGQSFTIPLNVSQSAKLKKPVRIELVAPPELQKFVRAEPIMVNAKTKTATMQINTLADGALVGDWHLTVKATALQDDRWPVVSQTKVAVRFAK